LLNPKWIEFPRLPRTLHPLSPDSIFEILSIILVILVKELPCIDIPDDLMHQLPHLLYLGYIVHPTHKPLSVPTTFIFLDLRQVV
jgi:hypothetical protein